MISMMQLIVFMLKVKSGYTNQLHIETSLIRRWRFLNETDTLVK